MSQSYIDAHLRYGNLNDAAIKRAQSLLPQAIPEAPPVTLSALNWADIQQTIDEGWQLNWYTFFKAFENRPKKFAFKIQYGGITCGMALGTMNRSKSILRIDLIEGNTVVETATKGYIIDIVLLVATTYAKLAGCKEIRCINPFDEVVPHYERAGFVLVQDKGFRFCGKVMP